MHLRPWIVVILLCTLLAALLSAPVASQDEGLLTRQPPLVIQNDVLEVPTSSMSVATNGAPRLSYRYERTFGVSEQAYVHNTTHFNFPWGIGTDGTHVWIGELRGRRAVKYTNNGTFITELGKAGSEYFQNQVVGGISDVGVDAEGNTWLVDGSAAHVLKFDASGNFVRELGKAWTPGNDNGSFSFASSIAFDSAGNVYISDGILEWQGAVGNHRIQVYNKDGNHLTMIGVTGVAGTDNEHLDRPRHIAIFDDILYIADSGNHRVQLFNVSVALAPVYMATIGTTGQFENTNSHFNYPSGVAVNASHIFVADTWNHRVQVFDRITRAFVATIGGIYGSENNQFKNPSDVAVDTAGNLYVADYDNQRVQQFNSARIYLRTFGNTGVPYLKDELHYNFPVGVTVTPEGDIVLVEENGQRLLKLDTTNGVAQWTVGEAGVPGGWEVGDNAHFNYPSDVALDSAGLIYVADRYNNRIQIFTSDGVYATTFGRFGTGEAEFQFPDGLTVGLNGFLYIADTGNHRVQIFDNNRNYVASLGSDGVSGADNAHFRTPKDVAVDSRGTIYVADTDNHRVQVFDANRVYVRTIGETGVTRNDHAHLGGPHRLFVDAEDRLYVADTWNNRVQVFDQNGAYLTTIGGSWGSRTGQLRTPRGVTVGSTGKVYVADFSNHRIQTFASGVPSWVQININGFGDSRSHLASLAGFNGKLYASTLGTVAQIWRNDDPWTPLVTDGFGNADNYSVSHLLEFEGRLYAGVANQDQVTRQTAGGEIWRSADGSNWEPVVTGGLNSATQGEVFHFAVFSDTLYAGTWSYSNTVGAEIWRSDSGNSGDWQQFVTNGLDDPDNRGILTLEVFSDTLYAGVFNGRDGAEVWRTDDGTTWERVATGGFGDTFNSGVWTLEPFADYLYAATANSSNNDNPSPGAELWRCRLCDGTDWQEVAGAKGFGRPDNEVVEALTVFNNHLLASTYNENGMEVWRSADGTTWTQVNSSGFGDSNNNTSFYDNGTTVFEDALYISSYNSANGGQVWKYWDNQVHLPAVIR